MSREWKTSVRGACVAAALSMALPWCGVALAQDTARGADGHARSGPESGAASEIEALRAEMRAMEARHRREMAALREELARSGGGADGALADEIDRLLDRMDGLEGRLEARPESTGRGLRLVDISLSGVAAGGWSDRNDETLGALQGGGHDPNRRGFTLQNVELILKGAVDPYLNAQANLITFIDRDGETVVELEEAFATTTSLPWGLQAKAGQFYAPIGRHNPQHPHQWEFVDQPFGLTRFLGPDGMRGQGAQLSWLLPTDFPLELTAALQNANGETMTSFLGANGAHGDEEDGHGHGGGESTFGEPRERVVRSLDDLVWSGRATTSFDLSDEWTSLFGASTAFGPNQSGNSAETTLRGADVSLRWKPLENRRGFPFVDLRVEWLERDYEFDGFTDDAGDVFGADALHDRTWYGQAVWGFAPGWTVGTRYEEFAGDAPEEITGLEDRDRWSFTITHYLSEFAKIRLQVNRDDSDTLGRGTAVWLQVEFNLGSHGAHVF